MLQQTSLWDTPCVTLPYPLAMTKPDGGQVHAHSMPMRANKRAKGTLCPLNIAKTSYLNDDHTMAGSVCTQIETKKTTAAGQGRTDVVLELLCQINRFIILVINRGTSSGKQINDAVKGNDTNCPPAIGGTACTHNLLFYITSWRVCFNTPNMPSGWYLGDERNCRPQKDMRCVATRPLFLRLSNPGPTSTTQLAFLLMQSSVSIASKYAAVKTRMPCTYS